MSRLSSAIRQVFAGSSPSNGTIDRRPFFDSPKPHGPRDQASDPRRFGQVRRVVREQRRRAARRRRWTRELGRHRHPPLAVVVEGVREHPTRIGRAPVRAGHGFRASSVAHRSVGSVIARGTWAPRQRGRSLRHRRVSVVRLDSNPGASMPDPVTFQTGCPGIRRPDCTGARGLSGAPSPSRIPFNPGTSRGSPCTSPSGDRTGPIAPSCPFRPPRAGPSPKRR